MSRVAVITKKELEVVLTNAGAAWESITNLKFSKKISGSPNIRASFQPKPHSADGERNNNMDAPAHASYPCDKRLNYIHLNEEFSWTDLNILTIVVHEMGHNLGLSHSGGSKDIMNGGASSLPCNMKDTSTVCFSENDKQRIQAKYGLPGAKKKGKPNQTKKKRKPDQTEKKEQQNWGAPTNSKKPRHRMGLARQGIFDTLDLKCYMK